MSGQYHREGSNPAPARVWRVSLGARFAFAALLVLSAVFLSLYVGLAQREREHLVTSKSLAGGVLSDVFARSLQGPLEFRDDDAIAAEMKNLDGHPAIRSVLVWGDGPEPVARLRESGRVVRPAGSTLSVGETRIALVRPVVSRSGATIGEVLIEMSLDAELAAFQRTRIALLVGATTMALATSALLVAIVRREIVKPLRAVATAASCIGAGQLGARADSTRGDEIGDLAAAFNNMAASLEDRELRLESVTQSLRELVDHMRQGIVAFDRAGIAVQEGSREAQRLFGTNEIVGRPVRELLYGDTPAFDVDVVAFDVWRELAFATPPDRWDDVASLAPHERTVGPAKTPVSLEFRPIVRQGNVLYVMLLASDVSHERSLERAVQTKDEDYARRMKAMRRLLTGGSQAFVSFVESTEERFVSAEHRIAACTTVMCTTTIDALFRAVHTVRGEARAFDMRELEREAEHIEEVLDDLRSMARGDGHILTDTLRAELIEQFRSALRTLYRERALFAEASPIGRAIFTQTTVQNEDLVALEAFADRFGGELAARVRVLRARPFGESAAGVVESASSWSAVEDRLVDLVVEHGEVPVDPALVPMLPGILAHLVRNAIAHGIESPEDRKAAGKDEQGVIRLSAEKEANGSTRIIVEDDGRGLDVEALSRLAVDGAMSLDTVLFAPGMSTRKEANELAGRGVGLDAVRTDLATVGYSVSVSTERQRFSRFIICKANSHSFPQSAGT